MLTHNQHSRLARHNTRVGTILRATCLRKLVQKPHQNLCAVTDVVLGQTNSQRPPTQDDAGTSHCDMTLALPGARAAVDVTFITYVTMLFPCSHGLVNLGREFVTRRPSMRKFRSLSSTASTASPCLGAARCGTNVAW